MYILELSIKELYLLELYIKEIKMTGGIKLMLIITLISHHEI